MLDGFVLRSPTSGRWFEVQRYLALALADASGYYVSATG